MEMAVIPQLEENVNTKSIGSISGTSISSSQETPVNTAISTASAAKKKAQKRLQYIDVKGGALEIEDEEFYHGYMTRTEAEKLLTEYGQFLVRKTEVTGERCFVMSVSNGAKVKHLKIRQTKKHQTFWLYEFCFESIGGMVMYHHQKGHPVHPSGLLIINHIKREKWELYHEQINLNGGKLGSGEFGEVVAGSLSRGVFSTPIHVAIKTLRGDHMTSEDRATFLREANVMLKLKHKHIVRLYGVATQREPIMIVMERATDGSLLSRVKKDKDISQETRQDFCLEIVDGMAYLEKQLVIHRDLAARNVLLNGNTCKISDFGLSLLGQSHRENKLSKVPVRWLAPETLTRGLYSSKTDVWSFGVVIYEIFTNGAIPYGDIKKMSVVAAKVPQGLRLSLPDVAPQTSKEMMASCFESDPSKRTSFADLKKKYTTTSLRGKLSALFA